MIMLVFFAMYSAISLIFSMLYDLPAISFVILESRALIEKLNLVRPALTNWSTLAFVRRTPFVSMEIVETCGSFEMLLIRSVKGS